MLMLRLNWKIRLFDSHLTFGDCALLCKLD